MRTERGSCLVGSRRAVQNGVTVAKLSNGVNEFVTHHTRK